MLVRPAFLREATVSPHFDEAENRTTRHVLYSDWKEYLVVWRQNRVELYEDYVRGTQDSRSADLRRERTPDFGLC